MYQGLDQQPRLSAHEAGLLKALLYFDIFSYPLKLMELLQVQPHEDLNQGKAKLILDNLQREGLLKEYRGYFGFGELPKNVERREKGNALAEEKMKLAMKRSRLIAKFPFVRAVMLSGSLSKGFMLPDADIDFFIVTKPKRLWVARSFLVLYKKTVLFNSHKAWCMNYFIDEQHLEIEDKNIFTATEVAYLLPTYNHPLYLQFREKNAWVKDYMPLFEPRSNADCIAESGLSFKKMAEWFLGGWLGEALDARFLRITLSRWQKKFGKMDPQQFEVAMRSREYVSKHHPSNFQLKVLGGLEKKWTAILEKVAQVREVEEVEGE